jgi:hypothetical protein
MRRIVRDYIAAALDRTRPELEQFIAAHLQCPEAVPLVFSDPATSIREIRSMRIMPRLRADFPEVDVLAEMQVSLIARTQRRGVDLGTRTFLLNVVLDAVGTVQADGYDLVPQHARLTAWWGG